MLQRQSPGFPLDASPENNLDIFFVAILITINIVTTTTIVSVIVIVTTEGNADFCHFTFSTQPELVWSSWRFEFESEYVEVRPGRALKSSKIILLQFHIPYHTILFQNGKQLSNHYPQIRLYKCRMYPVIKFNNLDCSLGKFNQARIGDTSTESQYHVPNIATNQQQTIYVHTISVINSAFLCDFCKLNLKPKESKESTFIHFALWPFVKEAGTFKGGTGLLTHCPQTINNQRGRGTLFSADFKPCHGE